jgi:hypothetical protein
MTPLPAAALGSRVGLDIGRSRDVRMANNRLRFDRLGFNRLGFNRLRFDRRFERRGEAE